jgi:hypothetical protein
MSVQKATSFEAQPSTAAHDATQENEEAQLEQAEHLASTCATTPAAAPSPAANITTASTKTSTESTTTTVPTKEAWLSVQSVQPEKLGNNHPKTATIEDRFGRALVVVVESNGRSWVRKLNKGLQTNVKVHSLLH